MTLKGFMVYISYRDSNGIWYRIWYKALVYLVLKDHRNHKTWAIHPRDGRRTQSFQQSSRKAYAFKHVRILINYGLGYVP